MPEGLPASTSACERGCRAAPSRRCGCAAACSGCCSASACRVAALEDIAKQGAAALELANDYTDLIEAARRRKPTTRRRRGPAPPVPAAHRAHHGRAARRRRCSPTYEVGGDWFDFVENRDGAWLAIADAAGNGPTAAGLSAAALGALRAARRSGQDLVQARRRMDEVVRALGNPDFFVTALLARWHAPDARSPGSTAATRPA